MIGKPTACVGFFVEVKGRLIRLEDSATLVNFHQISLNMIVQLRMAEPSEEAEE